MVRGKYRCSSVTFLGNPQESTTQRQFAFSAIYDTSTPENQRFTTYTPWGEVKFTVTNPDVQFEPGKEYYLDLSPVE